MSNWRTSRLRSWAAIAAAFALALQVMLTGILATQTAAVAADAFAICHGTTDGVVDQQAPRGEHPGCPACIICTGATIASLSAAAGTPIVVRFGDAVEFRAVPASPTVVGGLHSPRLSQGPPRIA